MKKIPCIVKLDIRNITVSNPLEELQRKLTGKRSTSIMLQI